MLGWHLNSPEPSLWIWQYSTVKREKDVYFNVVPVFVFLSSLPHTLSTLCPSSSPPFSVPAIVAPYFQPRGGQANRQLSPELIAKLVL